MQSDDAGQGDICIDYLTAGGCNHLVIHHQAGKGEVYGVIIFHVLPPDFRQTVNTAQVDIAIGTLHGRIPIEPLRMQSVAFPIINKGTRARIIDRQSVICRYPQSALNILHDSFHGIVRQAVIGRQILKMLLSALLVNHPTVQPIAV